MGYVTCLKTMDIPLLTSEYLYKLIESINTLQNSVIYQKRCSRLARRSCQIAEKVKIDERNKLNPKLTASLELLKTCLEDIENHVKRFSKLEKRLAVRVTKYGTDHEEFVKLNERMQFCVIELHLDFDTTVLFRREDDDQDLYDDVSHLKLMLNEVIMNLEVSASISKNLVEHTLEMVNKQMEEMSRADSISTKRPLSADIAISLDDLTFQKVIGSGGFGTVWKGTYKGEPVAIKKLKKQTLTPEVLQEFRKEAIIREE